jgi:hypothetical protein
MNTKTYHEDEEHLPSPYQLFEFLIRLVKLDFQVRLFRMIDEKNLHTPNEVGDIQAEENCSPQKHKGCHRNEIDVGRPHSDTMST